MPFLSVNISSVIFICIINSIELERCIAITGNEAQGKFKIIFDAQKRSMCTFSGFEMLGEQTIFGFFEIAPAFFLTLSRS